MKPRSESNASSLMSVTRSRTESNRNQSCPELPVSTSAERSWETVVESSRIPPGSVFADFSVGEQPYTLADDITVDGSVRSQALPAPTAAVTVDGLRVALTEGATSAGEESELAFTVTRGGKPVAIQDYLGDPDVARPIGRALAGRPPF